jgi:hypothetical protein
MSERQPVDTEQSDEHRDLVEQEGEHVVTTESSNAPDDQRKARKERPAWPADVNRAITVAGYREVVLTVEELDESVPARRSHGHEQHGDGDDS